MVIYIGYRTIYITLGGNNKLQPRRVCWSFLFFCNNITLVLRSMVTQFSNSFIFRLSYLAKHTISNSYFGQSMDSTNVRNGNTVILQTWKNQEQLHGWIGSLVVQRSQRWNGLSLLLRANYLSWHFELAWKDITYMLEVVMWLHFLIDRYILSCLLLTTLYFHNQLLFQELILKSCMDG